MQRVIPITIDIKNGTSDSQIVMYRGDSVKFQFNFINTSNVSLDTATKLRVQVKPAKNLEADYTWFAGETTITSENYSIEFTSSQTSGYSGNGFLAVLVLDANDETVCTAGIPMRVEPSGYEGIFTPSQDFRDEVIDAKNQAEQYATSAQQSATSASSSASAANNSATQASSSASAASASESAANNSATQAASSASNASNSATAAQQSANAAQIAAEQAQQISDPNNIIGSLQISKANTGMLYFTGGSNKYGTNGTFSAGEVFSVAYRTDFQFDYDSASAGQYRPWSIGNPASSNISVHGLGDDRLRVLYNGGGFCSYMGSNIRAVIKPINDIVIIVTNPTGGNMNTSLYVNGVQIPQASYSAKPSLEMTGYRLNALNYASSTIDITMKDFAIFNFDMSAEGAPYSVADYSAGKPVLPSALAQTAVLLENYTFTVGSTQYIPDVSGNNKDATIAGTGTVAGTFDKAIAKLASLITSTNA